MAQKAEVKGSWPGNSAGKGLLTEGPRTPTGGAQGSLAEAGSCFSLQSGRAA